MTAEELGRTLRNMYDNAPDGYKVANIHLFGVKYASEIEEAGLTAREIVQAAAMKQSYTTEVSKGVKLSRYVVPKSSK
jgi:hypothetical protein